jgi:hypothetical protein
MNWNKQSPTALCLFTLSALVWTSACAIENFGTPHPTDSLNFPVGVTAGPSGHHIWVTSGNFDLAYRGGALLSIDVDTHTFVPEATVEIGDFPGTVALRVEEDGSHSAYVASRADDAIYHIQIDTTDADVPTSTCAGGTVLDNGILSCDVDKALQTATSEDDGTEITLTVGPDPFDLLVHQAAFPETGQPDVLLSAAMVDGTLAVMPLNEEGVPELAPGLDLESGLFALAEHPITGHVYVSNKSGNLIHVLRADPVGPDDTENEVTPVLIDTLSIPSSVGGDQARSLAFSPDGNRLYIAYRAPGSLVVVNVAPDVEDRIMAKIPVGRRPSDVVVVPAHDATPERVYVSCFLDDRVDVVDPSVGAVVASIPTGHGPYGMDLINRDDLRRLYVANFYEHSVGVIELAPDSPWFHTEIAEVR